MLNELFFIEDKISNFEESLSTCTDLYLYDISQLEDEDTEGRKELEETFQTHRNKVLQLIKKLVCHA